MRRLPLRALPALLAASWLVATSAAAGPYGWTLSASNTDPLQNTGTSGATSTTVYLWLACDMAHEGVTSAEFGVSCSRTVNSFAPANGFVNAGTVTQPRLTISGCPVGPRLAGSFTVGTLLGAPFTMCLVPSSGGNNQTVTCGGHAYPNDVIGFTTDGSLPCGDRTTLCATSDIAVSIGTDDANPRALSPFHLTIQVKNNGASNATGVHVVDAIGSPLVYESHTLTHGAYNSGTGLWNIGPLNKDEVAQLSLRVHAGAGSAGNVVWNGAARVASAPFDPDSTNDADSVSVTIAAPPQADLRLTKTVSPARVCEGDSATFTLVVYNGGPDPGTSVQATDLLPAGMTYVSQVASRGSYDSASGIWTVGAVAVGDSATLALTVTLDSGTAGLQIMNTGAIAGSNQADAVSGNDADSVAVAVRATGSNSSFEAVTTAPSTTTTLHLDFTDDTDISDATLFYRNGGAAAFSSLAMTQGAAGVWSAAVPGTEVGRTGLQCYAQVTSSCTSTRVPASGYTNVSCRVDEDSTFVLPGGKYALLGVPFVADDATPTGLFDELAPYDTQRWRYGTWNGSGYGDGPGQARNAAAGQGFWIYSQTGLPIASKGWTTTLAQDFVKPLSAGWNQIANPFSFPIAFADLGRPAGISDDLVSYDGTGYVHFAATLEPGVGYWIRNTTSASLDLTFPVSPAGPAPAPPRSAPAGDGWQISLGVVAGSARDEGNVLGMRRDARDGDDAHDYAEAPAPPDGYLMAFFRDAQGRALQADFRALRAPGGCWDLDIASKLPACAFEIHAVLPQPLPDGWQAVLLDPTGLGSYPVADGAVARGRTLLGPETQTWHVVAGTPEYVAEQTRAVRSGAGFAGLDLAIAPNPLTRAGTVFTITLPKSDTPSLRLYDVSGRLVRDLGPGPLTAGLHRVLWDATNGRERAVPGVYFARLTTASGAVSRKVVVR